MIWDNTQDEKNSAGERYTHEVKDAVQTYRTVTRSRQLKNVALSFTDGYAHGDGDRSTYAVAVVRQLRTVHRARFAFNAEGEFEWQSDREIFSY